MNAKNKISQSAFLKRVKDTIKQYAMLHPGDRVLVAVSGGPDSVGLLKAFLELRKNLRVEVVVANLDHGIRGKESGRDSSFVKHLAKDLGLELVHKKISLKSKPRGKKSLEEKAREERYAFLKKAAKKKACNVIATGHTLDDQAETVLMRIVTGTSAAGLTGIPPVRVDGSLKIVRPFIRVPKEDILHYLKKADWKYVDDRTNKDTKFKRNKVRLEVLPFLEKINPRVKRSLSNLADTLREDFLILKEKGEKASAQYVKKGKSSVRLEICDLMLQPRALRKAIFKESIRRAGGDVKKLTHRHWMDMDFFLRASKKGKSLDFPGDIRATKDADTIIFRKRLK
jgi:tRNA(Ile)-lysidine synthase